MPEVIYTFNIETSDACQEAGTDSHVYVQLLARDLSTATRWRKLDILFRDDFRLGATDTFEVPMLDVGVPALLRIKLENWMNVTDEWLCNKVEVRRAGDDESAVFPIYSYIEHSFEVMEGTARLVGDETCEERMRMRKSEIAINKEKNFPWVPVEGNPYLAGLARHVDAPTYDLLPRVFKRFTTRQKDMDSNSLKSQFAAALGQLRAWVNPIDSLDSYFKFSDALSSESDAVYVDGWETDECQGWQMLNGVIPLAFDLCTALPDHFDVTDHDVRGLLRHGATLEDEIKNGRVYISDLTKVYKPDNGLDYTVLPSEATAYCCPAVALFYVNGDGNFVPVAIQLEPGDRDYLHVSDGSWDWMLAKMHFRCSLTSYHEWVYHFLHTHSIMEPVSVSLFRCLPKAHPIYKLLRPHLRTVSAINTVGRQVLLPKTSQIASGLAVDAISFVKKGMKEFKWNHLRIPQVLKNKGIDVDKIPNYWYARDALAIWSAMEDYCRAIIGVFYKTDEDVRGDPELQDWLDDLFHEGIGWEEGDPKGLPRRFDDARELSDFCTTIMFTNSAQHCAVNYGQFENYHFAPNSPAIMNLPPHKKGEGSLDRILKSLPDRIQTAKAVAMAFGLSQFYEADEFLGEFRERWFVEAEALECQKSFTREMERLQGRIEQRNAALKRKYNRLNPSRVPIGIAI